MADSPILVAREDRIAVITLNRPQDGNRWRKDMLYAFEPVVDALHTDEETQVVIIRGAGDEYFSWGAFDPAIRGGASTSAPGTDSRRRVSPSMISRTTTSITRA